MAAPTISIAMATYNGAVHLEEQLTSLRAQTYLPTELVVHDDRSDDKTVEMLKEFARTAPFPVRISVNEYNLGPYDNFLRCAESCSGEYVAFCDQDDIWDRLKLERIVEAIQRDSAVLVAHSATLISSSGKKLGRLHDRPDSLYQAGELHPWDFFYGFTCCFKRTLLDLHPMDLRPRDLIVTKQKFAHDRWVCFLASSSGRVRFLDQDLALYRQHEANASGWMRKSGGLTSSFQRSRQRTGFHFLKLAEIAESLASVADDIARGAIDEALDSKTRCSHWWSVESRAARAYVGVFSSDSKTRRVASIMNNREALYFGRKNCWQRLRSMLRDVSLACIAGKGQIERGRQLLR